VLEALKRRTWKETDHETEWDIFWTEKEWIIDAMDHAHLAPNQRVNHFRNYYELCRKDNLIKNLKRYKRNLEKEGKLDDAAAYNFFPTTYNLPGEYSIFCEEFKRNSNTVWIMKPVGKAQGKGIFLFNKLSQVSQWKSDTRWKADAPQVENYIVQRYINNPLLIGGKKFDMRIYCLVTSYSPLVAYLYRDGFARFTHHRYDNDDITNTYVHLTNVAIQKTSENYDEKLGGKWDLRTLKLYLMSHYGQEAVSECFANIQQVLIRSLQSVQKIMINDKHCFELYGFDILLDANLKPWLIEVNGSPSMTANTPHDFELKCNLLDDVFTIIDMERILTGQEEQIGGFDLICKGAPVKNESSLFSSMLSCHNNRGQQLKKLAKIISSKLAHAYIQQEKEEAKKISSAKDKDPSSISTTDTSVGSAKAKGKATPKISPNISIGQPKIVKGPIVKQNTISQSTAPKDIKEVREAGTVAKVLNNKPRESGRGKTPVGLPPVNSTTSNSQAINSTNNTGTPSCNGLNTNAQKGTNFSSLVNSMASSSVSTANQGLGKRSNQPSQGQLMTNPAKGPSTLQLAGGASLKPDSAQSYDNNSRAKGKNATNMQDFLDQKQNIYSYNINNDRPSSKVEDKSERYGFVKGSEDMVSKGKDNYTEESNENYEVSDREEYE